MRLFAVHEHMSNVCVADKTTFEIILKVTSADIAFLFEKLLKSANERYTGPAIETVSYHAIAADRAPLCGWLAFWLCHGH